VTWSILFGFLGGVTAVATKGAVDFYFERRREERAVRASARLVRDQMENVSRWAGVMVEGASYSPPGSWAFDHAVWSESKALLAASLGPSEWSTVAHAHRCVGAIEDLVVAETPDGGVDGLNRAILESYIEIVGRGSDALQAVERERARE
jgi:hypothetical protein